MKQKSVRILAILFVSLCVLSSGVPSASAAVEEPEFPAYVAVTQISPRLVVELGTAYCSDYIIIKSGYSVSATWYLQYYQSGKWENLATWTDTGTKSLPLFPETLTASKLLLKCIIPKANWWKAPLNTPAWQLTDLLNSRRRKSSNALSLLLNTTSPCNRVGCRDLLYFCQKQYGYFRQKSYIFSF